MKHPFIDGVEIETEENPYRSPAEPPKEKGQTLLVYTTQVTGFAVAVFLIAACAALGLAFGLEVARSLKWPIPNSAAISQEIPSPPPTHPSSLILYEHSHPRANPRR